MVVNNRFEAKFAWPYHACYVGRKWHKSYAHSHEEILSCLGSAIMHHEGITGIFRPAMGDYGYILRSPSLDEIIGMANYIQEV